MDTGLSCGWLVSCS
uniref:Uncharacterized protein n=1 Tax=Anguilla anguilla TaxID=7936 RepID=A0A0E9VBM4_ANGAN